MPSGLFREDGRLVGTPHLLEHLLELLGAVPPRQVEVADVLRRGRDARLEQLEEEPPAFLRVLGLEGEVEPVANPEDLVLVELLRLDEHAFGDRDLPEVVEERRRLQLANLLPREGDPGVGPVGGSVDDPGERHGEVGDPVAVAGGRRVAQLDRHDRAARAKSSKRRRIEAVSWFAFTDTAACVARESRSGTRSVG